MAHEVLNLTSVHKTAGYSHAFRAGNTLHIAGQIAHDKEGVLVGRGDIEVQTRQVYRNLRNIVEEAGGSLKNIVKMTGFLTDISYIDTYRLVRNELFSEPFPPQTLVIIKSLANPDFLIEIEATAELDG